MVETICLSGPALIGQAAPNLHLLLGLAANLGTSVGVPGVPAAVTELAGRRSKSRLAAAAHALTRAPAGGTPGRAEAAAQSVAALVSRAADANPARVP